MNLEYYYTCTCTVNNYIFVLLNLKIFVVSFLKNVSCLIVNFHSKDDDVEWLATYSGKAFFYRHHQCRSIYIILCQVTYLALINYSLYILNFLGSSDPHVNDPDRIPFAIG